MKSSPLPIRTWTRAGLGLLLVAVVCAAGGCEVAEDARRAVVEEHRRQARGHVGTLRAMEVQEQAMKLSSRLARWGDDRCGGLPSGPFEATVTIEAELVPPGSAEAVASFKELRRIRRDEAGHLQIDVEIDFVDPSGRIGQQRRQERTDDRHHYVQEENLPFAAHTLHAGDARALVEEALDAVPAVLGAGGEGWTRLGSGDVFKVEAGVEGGRALRCGLEPEREAWLRRLASISRVEYAEATLPVLTPGQPGRTREATARLLVQGQDRQWVMRLDVAEKVLYRTPSPIEPPQEVSGVRRDRPYRDLETILARLGVTRP